MNEKKKVLVVDFDSMFYHAAKEDTVESINSLEERIDNMIQTTGAHFIILFTSVKPYFRSIDSGNTYKSNRKDKKINYNVSILKIMCKNQYNTQNVPFIEADDILSILSNSDLHLIKTKTENPKYYLTLKETNPKKTEEIPFEVIYSSPDKDVFKTIPGKIFNYRWIGKGEDTQKGSWIVTTKKDKEQFVLSQMIIGDSADNVKGIPRMGDKAWEKIVEKGEDNINDIFKLYIKKFGEHIGIREFSNNYRKLSLLQNVEQYQYETGIEFPKAFQLTETLINQVSEPDEDFEDTSATNGFDDMDFEESTKYDDNGEY